MKCNLNFPEVSSHTENFLHCLCSNVQHWGEPPSPPITIHRTVQTPLPPPIQLPCPCRPHRPGLDHTAADGQISAVATLSDGAFLPPLTRDKKKFPDYSSGVGTDIDNITAKTFCRKGSHIQ